MINLLALLIELIITKLKEWSFLTASHVTLSHTSPKFCAKVILKFWFIHLLVLTFCDSQINNELCYNKNTIKNNKTNHDNLYSNSISS